MSVLDTATQWASLTLFKARVQANYLLVQARYAASIEASPEAFRERFWLIYGKIATTKALLMISRERIQRSSYAGNGNALLGINQAEAAIDVLLGTIKAHLTDARAEHSPVAKNEVGWVPVVLAIAGLGVTLAAILWALAGEKEADALLTYSQTVDRETQRMTAEDAARTLAEANPGAPAGPDVPKPELPGSSSVLLVAGVMTVAAAAGGVWWFTSRRK